MEFRTTHEVPHTGMPVSYVSNQNLLRQFIEDEAENLLGTLRLYVQRARLAKGESVKEVALELLSEVVAEALEHADRFDSSRQPMAWLLGIAANLIKQKQAEIAKRAQREVFVRNLFDTNQDTLSDGELFDRIASLTIGPAQDLESNEQATKILALVSEEDRKVLRLSVLHGLNGEELARELGIKPGAARVRFHRALNRLRGAWHKRAEGGKP